jgi:hypothetical protein
VGSAVGAIRDLFLKVKAIDAKHGKFDFVFCTGDFFGPLKSESGDKDEDDEVQQLLDGKLEGSYPLYIGLVCFLTGKACPIAPLECYIMQGEHPLPDIVIDKFAKTGGELCKRVFLLSESDGPLRMAPLDWLLGKSGIITTANGLRIACLGGIYDPDIYLSAGAAPVWSFLPILKTVHDSPSGFHLAILFLANGGKATLKHVDKIIHKERQI